MKGNKSAGSGEKTLLICNSKGLVKFQPLSQYSLWDRGKWSALRTRPVAEGGLGVAVPPPTTRNKIEILPHQKQNLLLSISNIFTEATNDPGLL